MNQKLGDMNDQMGKMVALQCSMDDVETLEEVLRLTPLASKVKYAFHCMVCLGVMKPPVIFATCCKKLIACKDCMRHWILGTCPNCRGVLIDDVCLFSVTNRIAFFIINLLLYKNVLF